MLCECMNTTTGFVTESILQKKSILILIECNFIVLRFFKTLELQSTSILSFKKKNNNFHIKLLLIIYCVFHIDLN